MMDTPQDHSNTWRVITFIFPFHYAAWMTASAAINEMVNASSEDQQEKRLHQWINAMISQLSNVEIVGSIMAAVVVGAFTWPNVSTSELSAVAYCMIRVTWYSCLILAIAAVAVGVQQSVFLMRLKCVPNGHIILRNLLSSEGAKDKPRIPRNDQIILWQLAVGLLEVSIYTWFGGIVVFVWDITRTAQKNQQTADKVVAGICLLACIAATVLYLWSMLRTWHRVWRCIDLLEPKDKDVTTNEVQP